MNFSDIKAGETYNVRVKVTHVDAYKNVRVNTVDENDKQLGVESTVFYSGELRAFSPITPENVIKNTETAPKYDPCRLFRKGDIVEPCSVNGRWCSHVWEDRSSIHYEVAKAEDPLTAHMEVKDPDTPHPFLVHAAFFNLVTPVEELFTIDMDDDEQTYSVVRGTLFVASYGYGPDDFYTKDKAKRAAQAECDRLNELDSSINRAFTMAAQDRKERENG